MADVFTRKKRSEVMSRIRSRGNKDTELALVKVFRGLHITGWRRHVLITLRSLEYGASETPKEKQATLRVRPDFVFPKYKLAVFVDGCFWHCCPLHSTQPKSNVTFWRKKLAANRVRDRLVTQELHRSGWRAFRLWEHHLKSTRRARLQARIENVLSK